MAHQPRIVILGGGPCGLGAATRLTELGYDDWALYESEAEVGGLSRSTTDTAGFLWDVGGHVIFSHYAYFDALLEHLGPKENATLHRKCLVFMQDGEYEVNYPLQLHVDELPPQHWQKCLEGLLDSYVAASSGERGGWKPANFAEWGNALMGPGIVEVFLRPYNEKLWAWPMETMSADWLGERVAVPDFKKVMSKFTTLTDRPRGRAADLGQGWGPNSVFKYPLKGGTGAIWTSVAAHLPKEKIICNSQVQSIDPSTQSIQFANGSTDRYDVLINTICLQTFARDLISSSYEKKALLQELSLKLKYCSVMVVGLGVKGEKPERLNRFHWGYFPAKDVPFYRCTVLSNYSPYMTPSALQGEHYSLLFETNFSHHSPLTVKPEELIDVIEETARRYAMVDDTVEVVSRWHQYFEYGYPTPTTDRDSLLAQIHEQLVPDSIYSRGRFGGWRYEVGNMDHSMMQGVEVVDHILGRGTCLAQEPTYHSPNVVNDPSKRGQETIDLQAFSISRELSTGDEGDAPLAPQHVPSASTA